MPAGRDTLDDRASQLIDLADAVLGGRRLILASNRGPVEFKRDEKGNLKACRGAGGVVTALASLSRYVRVSWVASALTAGDREAAEGLAFHDPLCLPGGHNLRIRFVVPPAAEYELYYNVFSNPILWFVQHRLHGLLPERSLLVPVAMKAWREGYQPVNRAFATALSEELRRGDASPVVMLHDYQLYLAAGYTRQRVPRAFLQQFIHIPWPTPDAWEALPAPIVQAICRGLLANDIVGLQTRRCVRNFLATCETLLPDAEVDYGQGVVQVDHRCTYVRSYPVSVDVAELRTLAASAQVREYESRLSRLCCGQTIIRIDRLDPSKNILNGFRAYDQLLERRPDLHRQVKFLAFLVPSRTNIPEYRRYATRVFSAIDEINAKHGSAGWKPIEVFYENNYPQAIAAMRLYDVLLVNSACDGMNLVSKEGPTVNSRGGVLVLSRDAGSYEELGAYALGVAPDDVEGTSLALEAALAMPKAERKRRAALLRKAVERNDLTNWLRRQFADIGLLSGRLRPAEPAFASA